MSALNGVYISVIAIYPVHMSNVGFKLLLFNVELDVIITFLNY